MHLSPADLPPADLPPTDSAMPPRLLLFVGPGLQPEAELATLLARSGWRCWWLADAAAALQAAAHARFDALVLGAPAMGGPPVRQIETLRQTLACTVLVVAPRHDEVDEIIALELGADAYLAGPLAPRRLHAHLTALMRQRPVAQPDRAQLRLGEWTLDSAAQRLAHDDGRHVGLTAVQAGLLLALAAEAGRVVPRAALALAAGPDKALHCRSVDVYVARLRRRLREGRVDGLAIDGVRGLGYTLSLAPSPRQPASDLAWWPRSSALPQALVQPGVETS
ncbi:MAG: response regulator transcription factor [Rubrivivax sp.]|nr:response regulator transcription factor [Rubrivivax sp.]